ncbi:tRNA(His) guanylyltransferase [Erysiphe necator]|nr:tRNA(His) guanylyltransferase [Erysiphe necator]
MANSKYEYVKLFEQPDTLLPETWLVVRIDGKGFHKFTNRYSFEKPNDRRNLDLMNSAAKAVMSEIHDIVMAYGVSDEYSKLLSTVVSTFTSYYIHYWPDFFLDVALSPPLPTFDGRVVMYPNEKCLRDYLSWRQVDCHINNLYNTTFWSLIQLGGLDAKSAEKELTGTLAADKHEILFSRFKINYSKEPEIYKKGTIVIYDPVESEDSSHSKNMTIAKSEKDNLEKEKHRYKLSILHIDLIKDDFWEKRQWILEDNVKKASKKPQKSAKR